MNKRYEHDRIAFSASGAVNQTWAGALSHHNPTISDGESICHITVVGKTRGWRVCLFYTTMSKTLYPENDGNIPVKAEMCKHHPGEVRVPYYKKYQVYKILFLYFFI